MGEWPQLFGYGFWSVIGLMYVLLAALAIAAPFLAWSVTRNVRKTRIALERIADALESPTRTSGAGVLKL